MKKEICTQKRIEDYIQLKKGLVNKSPLAKALTTGGLGILPVLTLSLAATSEVKPTSTYFRNNAQFAYFGTSYSAYNGLGYFYDMFNGQSGAGYNIYLYAYGAPQCGVYGIIAAVDINMDGVTGFGVHPSIANGGVTRSRSATGWFDAPDGGRGVDFVVQGASASPPGDVVRQRYVFYKSPSRIGWMQVSIIPLCDGSNQMRFIVHDYAFTTANSITTPAGSLSSQDCCAPLPVELLHFDALAEQKNIALRWQTISETNNAGFEIQRSSDGRNFQSLSFIEGKGNSFEQQEYSFEDKNLRKGQVYYYRLKQIDFDGQFEYSEVISAQLKGNSNAALFLPNPSDDGRTLLDYQASSEGRLNLSVFDMTGKQLLQQSHAVSEGNNLFDLDFSRLGTGMFFIKMEQDTDTIYEKLILN